MTENDADNCTSNHATTNNTTTRVSNLWAGRPRKVNHAWLHARAGATTDPSRPCPKTSRRRRAETICTGWQRLYSETMQTMQFAQHGPQPREGVPPEPGECEQSQAGHACREASRSVTRQLTRRQNRRRPREPYKAPELGATLGPLTVGHARGRAASNSFKCQSRLARRRHLADAAQEGQALGA